MVTVIFSVILPLLVVTSSEASHQMAPASKENYLAEAFLLELARHMSQDSDGQPDGLDSYIDSPERYLESRAMKALDDSSSLPLGFELEDLSPPSLRDREFLQHSSLWGSQLIGQSKEQQNIKPDTSMLGQMNTDPTLPAYCNPPNPCPVGFTAEDDCLEEFENTAAFSRNYQAMQDCMCDTEHMFDCPIREDSGDYDGNDFFSDLGMEHHKNLVAKKFHTKKSLNPFLEGEKLPIAAKKGHKLN